ncbi:DUF3943 domain-containing protein [Kaarinaea lacus]
MNWIRNIVILFLPMLAATISFAAETPAYTPEQNTPPLVSWNNLKISEFTVAAADITDEAEKENATTTPEKKDKPKRDCDALTYEITLFNPCPGENRKRLWNQTKVVFVGGFGVMGIIALLPEEISKWDRSEIGKGQLLEKWWENVKAGPVWDNDKWYINYIGHPYFGGVYYQGARKSGYNQWNSFMYSALMSTFYWEYGIEAFAEVPSLQDLVVTPLGGWIYGEWAHHKEQEIRARGGTALGSQTWGSISLFLLDPLGVIDTWVRKKLNKTIQDPVFHVAHSPAVHVGNGTLVSYDHWELKLAFKF